MRMHEKSVMRRCGACAQKAQAAIDFLISYGIALVFIGVTFVIIYDVSVVNPSLATTSCTPSPGFSCGFYAINSSGIVSIQLSQSLGASINIQGIACSTAINATGNKPLYGNIYVSNSITFYTSPFSTNTIYSGASPVFKLYCYSSSGKATGYAGNPFIGYIWLNYTIPGFGAVIQQVAALDLRYT